MGSMKSYKVDDPIVDPLTCSVEVTIAMQDGRERWCFFATPQLLASVGDFVEGTRLRMHLGVPNMIVVSELGEEIIDRVLRQLDAEGLLERHTLPL